MTTHDRSRDPISCIVWHEAAKLDSNDYNPNMVFTPELKLLEYSLLTSGWIQPVLITPGLVIVDGFHRWKLSQESQALRERYDGEVPCAIVQLDRAHAIMLTVRINRAKGTHAALRMHALVRELIDDHKITPDEVSREIGASSEEIKLLYQEGVFAMKKTKDYRYSKAWVPKETGTPTKADYEAQQIESGKGGEDEANGV